MPSYVRLHLSVCVSVCLQNNLKNYGLILMKFLGMLTKAEGTDDWMILFW